MGAISCTYAVYNYETTIPYCAMLRLYYASTPCNSIL